LAILNAVMTQSLLLPLLPSWLSEPVDEIDYDAISLKSSAWGLSRDVYLILHSEVFALRIMWHKALTVRRALTIYGSLLTIANALASSQVGEIFGLSSRRVLPLNLFLLALFPIVALAGVLSRRELKSIEAFPVGELSSEMRAKVRRVNWGLWAFFAATAVMDVLADVFRGNQHHPGLAAVADVQQPLAEEVPPLGVSAMAEAALGASYATALGLGLLRMMFGAGLLVGATVLAVAIVGLGQTLFAFLAMLLVVYICAIALLVRMFGQRQRA
jgi:hypothetical protein